MFWTPLGGRGNNFIDLSLRGGGGGVKMFTCLIQLLAGHSISLNKFEAVQYFFLIYM